MSETLKQMQQQVAPQDTTEQINKLVAQSSELLTCGPNCQKTKQAEKLKQKYLIAKENIDTAPNQLAIAAKDYYTYTQGTSGYNKYRMKELSGQAKTMVDISTTSFSNGVDNAKQLAGTYTSLNETYANSLELYKKYLLENSELQGEIDKINTDTVTSDRRSFYKSQGLDHLNAWYTFLKWIYVVLVIVYILGLFLSGSDYSLSSKLLILIFFVVYPFIITYFIAYIYNFFSKKNMN
jgi:hypothetical protein